MSFLKKIFGSQEEETDPDLQNVNGEEREMIQGIKELSETSIKEVIVPRIDVIFIPQDITLNEIIEIVDECGYSRFPVYDDTIDNVIGILYVKDLLTCLGKGREFNLKSLMRTPYFVPESKKLDSLLREFKRRHVHIAVAVDEYGGVSGIVCLEDIIEEIIGDIQDEFDNEREEILEVGPGIYLCDARIDIEDLNEIAGNKIPEEDFDTIGGFVFSLFGKIPVRYEKVAYENLEFIIQEMEGRKIKTIKLVVHEENLLSRNS